MNHAIDREVEVKKHARRKRKKMNQRTMRLHFGRIYFHLTVMACIVFLEKARLTTLLGQVVLEERSPPSFGSGRSAVDGKTPTGGHQEILASIEAGKPPKDGLSPRLTYLYRYSGCSSNAVYAKSSQKGGSVLAAPKSVPR